MNMFSIKSVLILFVVSLHAQFLYADCCAPTIFVPRQMAYNPIYEDALVFYEYVHEVDTFLFSAKPIYTQTVGNSLKKYFTIQRMSSMNVQENGSGDIDSLWFQVISKPGTFYASTLSFSPVQKTYGAMLYGAWMLPGDYAITVNTAAIKRKNNMHIRETLASENNLGQVPGFSTLTQAFANSGMEYGKICGTQSKGGFDNVQIKLLKNFWSSDNSLFGDIYLLVGIPTGHGSKAVYLFEPRVGSNHVELGLGFNAEQSFDLWKFDDVSLYGELKWHYGLQAQERRSFDMKPNGQWSRYLLFTTPTANADPFFAINDLTFKASVTPRNSVNVLLAAHGEKSRFSFELGYNFWYRQSEKVCPCINIPAVGIADLVGIAQLTNSTPVSVTTSSTATISQGVYPNEYQMARDASYMVVTAENINIQSGAQPASSSKGVFGSIGYHTNVCEVGINTSYEAAENKNTASVVSVWLNLDVYF